MNDDLGGRVSNDEAAVLLAQLLTEHPDALVSAIDEDGLFVPLPASIPLTTQSVAAARSGLDLVEPASRRAVVDAWRQATDHGVGTCTVVLAGESGAAVMTFLDVRSEHGVLFGVVAPTNAAADALDAVASIRPTPRLARSWKDRSSQIIDIDDNLTGMLGWTREEVVGRRSLDFIHPDDSLRAIDLWMECLAQPGATCRTRFRHRHRDGRWIWIEMANRNLLDDPEAGHVESELFDISDEMEAHESLRASEQLLRQLAAALPVGVAQFDLEMQLLYANGRLYEILGAPHDADGPTILRCIVDPQPVREAISAVARGADVDIELHVDRLDGGGRRRCALAMRALTTADGSVIGGVCSLEDVTEAARLRAELEARATIDGLTGCVNRATVLGALDAALADRPSTRRGVGVIFVDLDGFKAINDRHGHAIGDAFLRIVAARLREAVRGTDVVGRLGGDEFLVVSPQLADVRAAEALRHRLLAALADPVVVSGVTLAPSASTGVAWVGAADDADAEALVARADAAMYETKRAGAAAPDRQAPAVPQEVPLRPSGRNVADEVALALAERAFELHFQRIVDLPTGAAVGAEALLRWRRTDRVVAAGEFLPEVEAAGMMCELGAWVVDDVCRQAATARRRDLTWFVNLSPRELAMPGTVSGFASAIERHGVDPATLVVEVTERGLLSADGVALRTLESLHRLGLGLALDDFGTGWSSLSTLLTLPVSWLKIDRSFTVTSSGRGAAVIAGLVHLADGLGALTIAEGIETDDQATTLRDLGVQYAQGYRFGRPQPLTALPLMRAPLLR